MKKDIAVPEVSGDKVALKLSRNDLIELVVRDVRERHRAEIDEKGRQAEHWAQKFVDSVNEAALKKAARVVTELKAIGITKTISGGFCWHPQSRSWADSMETKADAVSVPITQEHHYGDMFRVTVKLTDEQKKYRDTATAFAQERAELLKADTNLAAVRAIVRQEVLHQSALNTPEGQQALAALRVLTTQAEQRAGKPLLLP